MQTTITLRVEVDQELGDELGRAYPLFGGKGFQEYKMTLEGDALRSELPLLLPFAERLGMELTGEPGQPFFPLPGLAELAGLVPFLARNLRVERTIHLCGEEDRRELPAETILSRLALQGTALAARAQ